MPHQVPKKNISSEIKDVKNSSPPTGAFRKVTSPTSNIEIDALAKTVAAPSLRERSQDAPRRKWISIPAKRSSRIILFAMLLIVVLGAGMLSIQIYRASKHFVILAIQNIEHLRAASADLKSFRPEDAEERLRAVQSQPFDEFTSRFLPLLRNSNSFFKNFQGLTSEAITLAEQIIILENRLAEFISEKKGEELIASLERIQASLHKINEESAAFSSAVDSFNKISTIAPVSAVSFSTDIAHYEEALGILIDFLKAPEPRHLLVFFQNSSELRPGGGFLGSYADITILKGAVENITFHDINEVDRTFTSQITPPKPLQLTVTKWKSADANWFFDFASSSKKIISFMERSELYAASSTTFEGAIAISPKIIEDLLTLTGPILLRDQKLKITNENLLSEIQKQVQLGQEARVKNPKSILGELAPVLFDQLSKLDRERQTELLSLSEDWVRARDLMVYFKNPKIEGLFDSMEATGRIYGLSPNFYGDYLAVVDANAGGGKTDTYIQEKITLESKLSEDGSLHNHLVVTRTHQGNKGVYWWHKVMNQDYLQIFTPQFTRLTGTSGGYKKTIYPKVNYAKSGYAVDPEIQALEMGEQAILGYASVQAHEEAGKNVFSTWSLIEVGETNKVAFDYTRRLPLTPEEGATYTFVFEKQSGTNREYHFEISAPVGFRWKENQLPIYDYKTKDPPGRLILPLTLEKN